MQCPIGDGELIAHTTKGENNLTVSYSTCPFCRGYWTSSFAANYIIPSVVEESLHKNIPMVQTMFCPICQKKLERATGENIPDSVHVYHCPESHGYFFPAGALSQFKKAQRAKISYHKLWNIPLAGVASVLLAGVLLLFAFQARRQSVSQARELFLHPHAYVIAQTHQVLITVQTPTRQTVTLHMPSLTNFRNPMGSADGRLHTLVVPALSPGTYTYFFTAGKKQSETFSFDVVQ